MMNVMSPQGSPVCQLLKKLLIVAVLAYGVKNRAEISQGVKDFLARNQMAQNTKESVKWLAEMLRPQTEAERKQIQSYHEAQHKIADDLRKEGVNPYLEYIGPDDPRYAETAAFVRKMKEDISGR